MKNTTGIARTARNGAPVRPEKHESACTCRELRAVQEREEKFRKLVEGSIDIIYEADSRGFFTFISQATRKILGYEPLSLVGRHFSELVREDWRATTVQYYRAHSRTPGATTYFEFPAVAADGRTVWIGQSVTPLTDGGFHATARDVTERRMSEERFNAFMNNSPTVAFIKQPDGRYVYANDRMNRLFAGSGKSVIGVSDDELLPANLAHDIMQHDEQVLRTGQPVRFVESAPTADGDIRQWLTYKFPVAAPDGTTYVGGVAVDLTDRIQLENDLAAARDAALASARQKSQFLANMSHEIRTPMNGVLGLLGVLLDSELSADQRDLAATARSSAESLLTIINDILDISKMEAGKLNFESLEFDVRGACEATLDLLAETARSKDIEIGCVIDPGIPAVLRGDAGRLRQILLNVLGNAIKFTEEGGVLLQVDCDEDAGDAVVLRFRVTDTGLGMSESTLQRLFQPFSQADESTTRRFGGTGLGLAISKQLVQMMDGEIGAISEPGCGSTFWFTVRLASLDTARAADQKLAAAPRVLVVEDSTTTRQMISLQLTAWGVPNEAAVDGLSALAMLRDAATASQPFDLVISDLQMPAMDGSAIARFVAKSPDFGTPRFVLMTNNGERFDASTLRLSGVTSCLIKPVKQQHLFSAVFGGSTTPRPAVVAAPVQIAVSVKPLILVADDNAVNQKVALRQLQKLGFRADAVSNGHEALEALSRIPYALVLMDCQMPEMDGYQATAEIRRLEKSGRRTPVVALTASASDSDRDKCLAAGMDDFVTKPVRENELRAALQRWLN